MLLSLPCLDFFKTSWDSSPLHWIYREPLAYSHVSDSVRKASVSRPTVLDRASRPPLSLSLSLSLSLARARGRSNQSNPAPRLPRRPAARSKAVLLDLRPSSFLVAFQARRGPTTRSLLGSRTKDLLSFFTTRCVELASKNNEFTFETKKSSHLKLFYSRFFFHLILKPLRGACKTVQKTRRTTSCAAGGGDGPEPEHGRGGREEGGEFDTSV